jgi:hypothetical protein
LTREQWLMEVVAEMRPDFKRINFPIPEKIRVGMGWPSSRPFNTKSGRVLGECWHPEAAKDKVSNIVISLYLDESLKVAGTRLGVGF